MKFPRLRPLSLLAATLILLPALASAQDDASRRAAAEEFLRVRGTEGLVNHAAEQMGLNTDRISDQAAKQAGPSVNQQEFAQKLKLEARTMVNAELNWESLKPSFIEAYSQAFTEAELKEMTAFFKSPPAAAASGPGMAPPLPPGLKAPPSPPPGLMPPPPPVPPLAPPMVSPSPSPSAAH